jgi:hypothetical protein
MLLDPSLGILTPSFGSISAQKIQKEELWENAVQNQQGNPKKRVLTPEHEEGKGNKTEGCQAALKLRILNCDLCDIKL